MPAMRIIVQCDIQLPTTYYSYPIDGVKKSVCTQKKEKHPKMLPMLVFLAPRLLLRNPGIVTSPAGVRKESSDWLELGVFGVDVVAHPAHYHELVRISILLIARRALQVVVNCLLPHRMHPNIPSSRGMMVRVL